jgi:hypothetical protein
LVGWKGRRFLALLLYASWLLKGDSSPLLFLFTGEKIEPQGPKATLEKEPLKPSMLGPFSTKNPNISIRRHGNEDPGV